MSDFATARLPKVIDARGLMTCVHVNTNKAMVVAKQHTCIESTLTSATDEEVRNKLKDDAGGCVYAHTSEPNKDFVL